MRVAGSLTELLNENRLVIPRLEKELFAQVFAFWDMTREGEGREGGRTEVVVDIDIAVNPK